MPEILPVLVGTVVAFVIGFAYYAVLGDRLVAARVGTAGAAADTRPSPSVLGVEVVRCLVLAAVVVGLAAAADVDTWWGGLLLGLVLWVGFPLVLLSGAVVHERTPVRLAALHGGDWLVKLLALGLIAGLWP
jgi:hypothetical protein